MGEVRGDNVCVHVNIFIAIVAARFVIAVIVVAAKLGTDSAQIVAYLLCPLLNIPLTWSFIVMFLSLARGNANLGVGSLFDGFKEWGRVTGTLYLQNIYIFLWMLLLIIPGIVKSFSYSMTAYILKDEPNLGYNKAIEKSMAMMDGHKWELFCLWLSFIDWIIPSILTCGIASLWMAPYMYTASAEFYLDVKEEYEGSRIVNPDRVIKSL